MKGAPATRRRFVLVTAVAVLLLLSTVASAGPGGGNTVAEGTIAGGGYRLTSASLPADGMMSGGGYQLLTLTRSSASGSGCCCTYLPCVLRRW